VVSEAVMKGIDREIVLDSIEYLKTQGKAYEPKNGEIKYVF
jgi:DNA replicative helicase MCM subunit Mcm2 (Cdc46/Mcm family)